MTTPKRSHRHPVAGLAKLLRTLRDERGFSFRQAARLSGVSHHHIKHLEEGDTNPSVGVLVSLCEAYGADPVDTLRELLKA